MGHRKEKILNEQRKPFNIPIESNTIDSFKGITLPTINKKFPAFDIKEFLEIQPLSKATGLVFYLDEPNLNNRLYPTKVLKTAIKEHKRKYIIKWYNKLWNWIKNL